MLNLSFPRFFVRTQDFADIFETFATATVKNSPGFVVFVPPTEKCVQR